MKKGDRGGGALSLLADPPPSFFQLCFVAVDDGF